MPEDALRKRIILKFSWAMESPIEREEGTADVASSTNETLDIMKSAENVSTITEETVEEYFAPVEAEDAQTSELMPEPAFEPAIESTSESIPESMTEPVSEPVIESNPEPTHAKNTETLPPNESPAEPVPAEEVSFIRSLFFPTVRAQEVDPEEVIIETSTTTTDMASSTPIIDVVSQPPTTDMASSTEFAIPEGAIMEVRYTLDGEQWESLGYISEIRPDINFEMPMDIFSSIADLKRVQVALYTVPTFDDTRKIYLDAMWMEVEYENQSPEKSAETEAQSESSGLLAAVVFSGGGGTSELFEEEADYSGRTEEEDGEEEPIEIEMVSEEQSQSAVAEYTPPSPALSVRTLDREIFANPEMRHRCEAEFFRVDISRMDRARGCSALSG
ncbi:MAG: hypothetical protein COY99_01695 [Candidatus Yonathbacteria bacterium CG_4_10_14_0_8_um_filter_47_645]|uniref:Uncharacterized protein n=2 Tax=Parcubacteria group TaxID=1794811 RepID=A0A1J4VAT4_9BACT|nr:MAG: hypothetical protein AUJ44_03715 [Candidatus Nomurabacteria bacterium CG1_02_47_685]PIP03363.1 MAG: hypothetical protein COX54_03910 [Candidatus Yonathbacteria bacterium CG23_combo_of_CG06-09_8_20_14_all_46_18]PIY57721.1 MAG: hypothetical protein COY99_01695 [Candidatus Yonathbacteria bacterium CG_4_10_14_0_8_um_filter_47_645]PJC66833.1 MAG: hypothetical protein CO016_04425 [Candidatus Yonathbacteria bacterium CG_4_8_14_3_um_filter_46_25]